MGIADNSLISSFPYFLRNPNDYEFVYDDLKNRVVLKNLMSLTNDGVGDQNESKLNISHTGSASMTIKSGRVNLGY